MIQNVDTSATRHAILSVITSRQKKPPSAWRNKSGKYSRTQKRNDLERIEARCVSVSITPSGMYNVDISFTIEDEEINDILEQIDNDVIASHLRNNGYKVEEVEI